MAEKGSSCRRSAEFSGNEYGVVPECEWKAPSYLQAGTAYYSYDGHYFYTDYGTMLNDYQNGTRSASVNPGNPYYNYYQYLPFRSRTSYSGAELNGLIGGKTGGTSKLNNTGDYFTGSQNQYGVNALIMVGIGANES